MSILADNQGALKLMANPMTSPLSKHIDVLHHFVCERVLLGHVTFTYVDTAPASTASRPCWPTS